MMIEQLGAMNLKSSGRMMIEKMMIQIRAKHQKNSGGVRGGGSPAMMIEQLGAKNVKSSGRMMIEKLMIQIGAKSLKNSGGVSPYHDDSKKDNIKKISASAAKPRIQSRAN